MPTACVPRLRSRPLAFLYIVAYAQNRLLVALKSDFVGVAASRISAPAAGEPHRGGLGALPQEDAHELVRHIIRFWQAIWYAG